MGALMRAFAVSEGTPWPLGATVDENGVNFALFSAHAERVELCVFENGAMQALDLTSCTDHVWHGHLQGARAGIEYAYRVRGPRGPGHRFDPERLLIDPYARDLTGEFSCAESGAASTLKCRVVDGSFDWGGDAPPGTRLEDSFLYEVHVGGATRLRRDIPEALRGTYAGLASDAMIRHYQRLGVTAIELMPIQYFIDEERLDRRGFANYWGYNTIAYFVASPRYARKDDAQNRGTRAAAREFRSMVKTLHAEGIEVLLDVVFNHTAETDASGPTISFRGIDNLSYYRHPPGAPDEFENFSGCGNTLNLAHPRVLQFVMDALRFWVTEMHVDGFRFDLAVSLVRDSAFLAALAQDPVLSRVKLIAEPWDLGPDGYRVGGFPLGWSEWNDRFRDDARMFWLTRGVGAGRLAQRLAGSEEVFRPGGRTPFAGVNFLAVHDGFTLRDLVSFNERHNERNGEDNRDGCASNYSCNCGEEGGSADPVVLSRRRNRTRALLTTLFMAQGLPLLQAGDESGRTQSGNNNAYCQDNAITWIDWENADDALVEFTARLSNLRRRFLQTRRRAWLTGETGAFGRDVLWWHPDGREMRTEDWDSGTRGFLGCLLAPLDADGDFLLIVMNRDDDALDVFLPPGNWRVLCDTVSETPFSDAAAENPCRLGACAVKLLARSVCDRAPG
ncbi:MAG: glycogen debranching protein GlgX [Candidatus Accumulibacter sp.]|jgi:glycogen operon protein|nr:glycogen debranching protein GlgX [Accumulibacter sp.]